MYTHHKIFLILAVVLLNGCASMTHFNKETKPGDSSAVFVDAKQRGVFNFKKTETEGNKTTTWDRFCAEPSPDAISSLAATLGVDLTLTDKGKLGVSHSIAESVGSIGLRTAAIEALRDIMYRNCEAYALGGVSQFGLETLQRRFQSTMVAILAIEQLTGAVRAPAMVIYNKANSGAPDAILDLTNKTETARAALDQAKKSETDSKAEFDKLTKAKTDIEAKITDGKAEADRIKALPNPSEAEKKKLAEYAELSTSLTKATTDEDTAKKKYLAAQLTTKERDQAYKALDSSRIAALTSGGSSSATGIIESIGSRANLSDVATQHVSSAVKDIVNSTINLSYSNEVCTTLIGLNPNIKPVKESPLWACTALLVPSDPKDSTVKTKLFNMLTE
jgi:hypothetical protein